jgi:putative ABC transport system permease protein
MRKPSPPPTQSSRLRQLWPLALRGAIRHKARTAMTLGAIAFGIVAMILTRGFVEDSIVGLGESLIHSQSGHLQVSRAGYFENGATAPERYLIPDVESVVATIEGLRGVDDVLERIAFSGLINNGRTDHPIIGEGVEPGAEARLGTYMTISSGRQLADTDVFSVLIGNGVAQALGLQVGDRVTLVVSAGGAMNALDFDVVGIFKTYMKEFDDRALRIPVAAARDLLGTAGANAVVVSLHETGDTSRVRDELVAKLGEQGYEVKTWIELNDFYENAVSFYAQLFAVLQLVILVMLVLTVSNSVAMSVTERTAEFGTMLALGNDSRDVFALVLLENAVLGVLGALLGAGVGVALALTISRIGIPMPPPPNSELGYVAKILVVPSAVVGAMLIACCAAILAGVGPARRIARLPVVDALRSAV